MTWEQIINHPLIQKTECIKDYDGKGKHMIVCIDGYRFEANNSTMEIGNLKELSYEIKSRLEKQDYPCENELNGGNRCDTVCPDCNPTYLLKQ